MSEAEVVEEMDVGFGAPGYVVNYVLVILLAAFNFFIYFRRGLQEKKVLDHVAKISEEGLTEFGYNFSKLGAAGRFLTLSYLLWMQASLLVTIVFKYMDIWPYTPPSAETNQASWDSYTRAFLLPWIATFIMLCTLRKYSAQLKTFYMAPCALAVATHVRIISEAKDESGNVIETRKVCQVIHGEGGIRLLEFQLLRYVYCSRKEAFTAYPVPDGSEDTGTDDHKSGAWAHQCTAGGGLTASLAHTALVGAQGRNEIQIEVPSFMAGCSNEFFTFFYIYQFFAVTLSFYWDYVTVGLAMLILVVLCGIIKVFTERQQRKKLREMATITEAVWTRRDGGWKQLACAELCVGDVICVTNRGEATEGNSNDENVLLAADALVVSGACVADESLLTGETMPIQKFPVPDADKKLNPESGGSKKYYLFSGTFLLDATGADPSDLPEGVSDGAIAVVSHVGPRSTRGNLLRTLLYGAPLKLQLADEAKFVLFLLLIIAVLDFMVVNATYAFSMSSVLTATFMIIAIISPLLSVAVLGGQLASAKRLNEGTSADDELKLFVRDVDRVALAGKVEMMCFDKTGTITKGGLDLIGFVYGHSAEPKSSPAFHEFLPDQAKKAEVPELVSLGLAVTHTVSRLGDRYIGHQVELRMVEAAEAMGWKFDQSMKHVDDWSIERQWTFDHHTMTMSVIVTSPDSEDASVFVKGSFEAISGRCAEDPSAKAEGWNWNDVVEGYSSEGCYVIAIAHRSIPKAQAGQIGRDSAETRLSFLGLIAFRNEPKHDSAEHLATLASGGVGCVMVTGDSALTGIAIARTVGIVPEGHRVVLGSVSDSDQVEWREIRDRSQQIQNGAASSESLPDIEIEVAEEDQIKERVTEGLSSLTRESKSSRKKSRNTEQIQQENSERTTLAVTGDAFAVLLQQGLLPDLMSPISVGPKLRVYGRMTPQQKVQVVQGYAAHGLTVGMCGDGGNDSGALRAAHAGLALSGRAEASVAAPFSTGSESLGALVLLLREGRASLCTSFAAYRFLVVRGIVWTQAKNIMLLIAGLYLAPLAYVYLDMLTISLLLWTISLAKPSPTLAPRPPEGSLFGPQNVIGATISCINSLFILAVLLVLLFSQPWFVPFETGAELFNWQARSDNYESPIFFVFVTWHMVDLSIMYSAGHLFREPFIKNRSLLVVTAAVSIPVLILLFTGDTDFNCAFKVNCDRFTYYKLKASVVNYFLFPYEQIGGSDWFHSKDSTTFPILFRVGVFFVLLVGSAIHQTLYRFIVLGYPVQEYIPRKWGWDDGRTARFINAVSRTTDRMKGRAAETQMREVDPPKDQTYPSSFSLK